MEKRSLNILIGVLLLISAILFVLYDLANSYAIVQLSWINKFWKFNWWTVGFLLTSLYALLFTE